MNLHRLSLFGLGPAILSRAAAWLSAAACAAALAGCSSKPVAATFFAPTGPTFVSTAIVGANVNPDARKRPSPVVLRVYELKSNALFESADFVSLFEKDQTVLGAELVSREEVILQPNDVKAINKNLSPETKFVAVFAAFRDLERARWRSSVQAVQGKKNVFKIRVDAVTVEIKREEP
jgi:type VI secretion system protein VasD